MLQEKLLITSTEENDQYIQENTEEHEYSILEESREDVSNMESYIQAKIQEIQNSSLEEKLLIFNKGEKDLLPLQKTLSQFFRLKDQIIRDLDRWNNEVVKINSIAQAQIGFLDIKLENFFSGPILDKMKKQGLEDLNDLTAYSREELLVWRNWGEAYVNHVESLLASAGLELKKPVQVKEELSVEHGYLVKKKNIEDRDLEQLANIRQLLGE